jgi:hypothetical protein
MPTFKVAHLNQQGQDMVIVPLDSSFGYKSKQDQNDVVAELQRYSNGAGLRGTVVPVWESGGRMHFLAPSPWHPFFASISMQVVWANINKELSW